MTNLSAQQKAAPRLSGLSARLMALVILFVLLAEILIFVPSIAGFRNSWLNDRLTQARVAALVLDGSGPDALPRPVIEEMLRGMDTTMIALRVDQSRRLLAAIDMPPPVDFEIDLRHRDPTGEVINAFNILIYGAERTIRVVGTAPGSGEFVEIVIGEARLRDAMIAYSRSILVLSLLISGIVAGLLFFTLNALIVRPVRALSAQVSRFRQMPEDARTLLAPMERRDEIGALNDALSQMQHELRNQLRQREHLAQLGLAVSRINHDLRNMLASAQLMADRLSTINDTNVQRFAPKLIGALDRAITFCQTTLSYGRAEERLPVLRPIQLAPMIEEIIEQQGGDEDNFIKFERGHGLEHFVFADEEHLYRILTNLVRNARAALETVETPNCLRQISFSARYKSPDIVLTIQDNGPGIPDVVRGTMFKAFGAQGRSGGSGLGLAISSELARSMGAHLELIESSAEVGTRFEIAFQHVATPADNAHVTDI